MGRGSKTEKMRVEKFEDLEAWKEARKLTHFIYNLTKSFSRDFGLRDQIQRSAASTMANIAEGFDSGSDQHFIQFLSYSRRSASEVQSHLYVALDNKYISDEEFQKAYDNANSVRKLCVGLIKYLKEFKTRDRRPVTRDH